MMRLRPSTCVHSLSLSPSPSPSLSLLSLLLFPLFPLLHLLPLLLLLLPTSLFSQPLPLPNPTLVTISEYLYGPDNKPLRGSVTIQLNASCVAPPNTNFVFGGIANTVRVNSDGLFSVQLVPNSSCTPQTSYYVTYDLVNSSGIRQPRSAETWYVPDNQSSFRIHQVRQAFIPPAVPTFPITNLTGFDYGALVYGSSNSLAALLPPNTSTTTLYLSQTGNGTVPNPPEWRSLITGTGALNDCLKIGPNGTIVPSGGPCGGSLIAGSPRITLSLSGTTYTIDADQTQFDLTLIGGFLPAAKIATASKRGNGGRIQMAHTFDNPSSNECAKYDADGNITGAGSACVVTGESYSNPAFITALDWSKIINAPSFELTSNKNQASGYAGLTASTKLVQSQGQEVWSLADLSDVTAKRGNSTTVQMATGTFAEDHCAKFDADGNLVSAGAPCNVNSGVAPYAADMSSATTWSVPGTTHNFNTCDLLYAFYAPPSGGTVTQILPNTVTCNTSNYDVTVSWSTAASGRILIFKSGGDNSGGCPNCVLTTGSYSNPSWINTLAFSKLTGISLTGSGSFLATATSTPSDGCAQWSSGNLISSGSACASTSGFVPTSRTISTTSPLSGGGDLTTDRTLSCPTCLVSSSTYSDPSWLTSLAFSKITGVPSYQLTSQKNQASGYAGLTASTKLEVAQGQEVWALADLSDVTGKRGNSTTVQLASGTFNTNDCAKFDANGNLVSAGAPCGTGAGGGSAPYAADKTSSTTWTVLGTEHNIGSCDLTYETYRLESGTYLPLQPNTVSCNATTFDVTITWSTATAGRILLFAGGGSGSGDCTNCVLTTGSYSNPAWLTSLSINKITGITFTSTNNIIANASTATPAAGCAQWNSSGQLTSTGTNCGAGGGGTPGGIDGQIQYNNNGVFGGLGLGYGLQISSGLLQVNPASVPTFLTGTLTFNFGFVAQNACAETSFSLPGAMIGDSIIPGWPQGFDAGFLGTMYVSAVDTVTIRICKITAGSLDPPERQFRATIVRSF